MRAFPLGGLREMTEKDRYADMNEGNGIALRIIIFLKKGGITLLREPRAEKSICGEKNLFNTGVHIFF